MLSIPKAMLVLLCNIPSVLFKFIPFISMLFPVIFPFVLSVFFTPIPISPIPAIVPLVLFSLSPVIVMLFGIGFSVLSDIWLFSSFLSLLFVIFSFFSKSSFCIPSAKIYPFVLFTFFTSISIFPAL